MKCHWFFILEYANYKLDLHKLLAYPLRLIENPVDFKCKFFGQDDLKMLFNGVRVISATMPDGLEVGTILPVNLHAQFLQNRNTPKKIIIPHYYIPVEWGLFNIQECVYYSGFDEGLNQRCFIHFDNSISVYYEPKGSVRWWWNKQSYERVVKRWSGKSNARAWYRRELKA